MQFIPMIRETNPDAVKFDELTHMEVGGEGFEGDDLDGSDIM